MNERPTVHRIQRTTARHFKVSLKSMSSRDRHKGVVRPRQVAMTLAKELTENSLPQLGKLFGGRDHTTVLHAINKITALMETDEGVKKDYEFLQFAILEGLETSGDAEILAKLLAPMIVKEINLNFTKEIETARAKTCKSKMVTIVTHSVEPELLAALEHAESSYQDYQNDQFSNGELLSLKRFCDAFKALRDLHEKFIEASAPEAPEPKEKS